MEQNAWIFKKLAPASILYTIVYTLCIYKNTSGVTMPLWIGATIVYACYGVFMTGKMIKKESAFLIAVMLLLGVSTFMTGNMWIIGLNYIGFFILLVCFLLNNLKEEIHWDVFNYVAEFFCSIFGAIASLVTPFIDGNAFLKTKQKKENSKMKYVIFGICIAIPCLLFLGVILMSADMIFANLMEKLFRNIRMPEKVVSIGFMLLFGFFSSYCGLRYLIREKENRPREETQKGEPVLAITVTGLIAVLYLIFCGIQILYLFIGNMKLPRFVTYAEYARTGFFQLLFVCILNLVVVLSVERFFWKNRWLDVVLLVISGCTMIMTASSAWRMVLYIGAYHLTFLRIAVLVALFAIALLMVGVMVYIVRPAFPLLRYGVVIVSVLYLGFAFSHVDYFIASYNLAKMEQSQNIEDYMYIASLSTDAAPAIADYLKENPSGRIEAEEGPYNWKVNYRIQSGSSDYHATPRNFNVSRYIAKKMLTQ